jgi:uncharacterized protein
MGMYRDRNSYSRNNPYSARETHIDSSYVAETSFTMKVYGWMTVGLAFTALIAFYIYQTGSFVKLMPFWWLWTFGALGVSLALNASAHKLSATTMSVLFLVYSGLQGLFFGTVLPGFATAYGGDVIWSAFTTAAAIFGVAVCYGAFTKSDLTSLGNILRIGLYGLLAVTLVYIVMSFFIDVTWMTLLISYLGLAIFVGLTVYEAQQIRQMSHQASGDLVMMRKLSVLMALRMYINVIMIFWYLLQIFASGRNK